MKVAGIELKRHGTNAWDQAVWLERKTGTRFCRTRGTPPRYCTDKRSFWYWSCSDSRFPTGLYPETLTKCVELWSSAKEKA